MLKKLLLLSALFFSPLLQAEEPRSFYEFMYGEGTGVDADNNLTTFGVGARFTFPVNDDFFIGFKGDATFSNKSDNGYVGHLAFSVDIRLQDDLYLTGDIGHAWGHNAVTDENGTVAYNDEVDAHGEYHTAGLRYQLSEYVEIAALYRNTLFTPVGTSENIRQEEILFSLNFAITQESLEFFHFLSQLGN